DAYNRLGDELHRSREQRGPAAEAFARAVRLLRALVRETPEDAEALADLGGYLNNLAIAQPDLPASPRAVELVEEAASHQRAAQRLRPGDIVSRTFLRNHLENLAIFRAALGKKAEAAQAFGEVVQLGEEVVREFPSVPGYRAELYGTYMNWATFG